MAGTNKKVLVIEDDISLLELMELHLEDLDSEVTKAVNGKTGLELAQLDDFDLIVLDIKLPDTDGYEICKTIRSKKNYTPILMVTSKKDEIDKVLGLELGADDYLTKPFGIREFIARVKAILRRMDSMKPEEDHQDELRLNGLKIEFSKRKVIKNNNTVELTPKEFELLYFLASHPGKTYTREQLLNKLWDLDFRGYEHTVNSHINRLRRKIEDDLSNPKYIRTIWGVGYKFNDELLS